MGFGVVGVQCNGLTETVVGLLEVAHALEQKSLTKMQLIGLWGFDDGLSHQGHGL